MTGDKWLEAQYGILGSILISEEVAPKVLLETTADDFSGPCRTVYEAVRKLCNANEPVDPVSVNHVLNGRYGEFLLQLMEITPSAGNLDHHIRICREQAQISAVRHLANELSLASSAEEMRRILEQINGKMVDRPGLRITNMAEGLTRFYARQAEKAEYLSWPIQELSERLYAKPGSFIVIGGSPSTGKSAWALQCATHLGRGKKVGFFSLETDRDILMDRMLSSVPEMSMDEIKRHTVSQRGWDALAQASTQITAVNLDLIPAAGMTTTDIQSVTMMKRYDVIFIDYLQLIIGSGSTRAEEVAKISMALHTMAQSMGVTVIALSQLKRKGEADSPSMSDLRESGQIEQDADIVMILQLENEDDPSGPRGLYIAKNKEGTCFKIKLDFDGKHQIFSKSNKTGETVRQLKNIARKAQNERRREAQANQQLSMLPENTWTPFDGKDKENERN